MRSSQTAFDSPDNPFRVGLRGHGSCEQVRERFLRTFDAPTEAVPSGTGSRTSPYRSLPADRRVPVVPDNAATVAQVRPADH